jgi:hypothetical protein
MPSIKCANGKWKWGERGKCMFETKQQADKSGVAISIQKAKKYNKKML